MRMQGVSFMALVVLTAATCLDAVAGQWPVLERPASRALAVCRKHPHVFVDAQGRPVWLLGDYTWGTFSDVAYDYGRMFDTLRRHGLNFARVWVWWGLEQFPEPYGSRLNVIPYLRPGPGQANDGRPKYDLTRFHPAFFARLRAVCDAGRKRGLFLQLTLFDAWMIKHPNLWRLHAYHRDNNINGVDGDPGNTGTGTHGDQGFCSLTNTRLLEVQKQFVARVVEAVGDCDNILFEIANENYYNPAWEQHLCDYLHGLESHRPRQHLVMPADLPNHDYGGIKTWKLDALHTNLLKARSLGVPLIFDTDGLGNPDDDTVRRAAWTAFASGGHVSYLDDSLQPGSEYHGDEEGGRRATLRAQLGALAAFVRRTAFWELSPASQRVVEGRAFVLASDRELVAYLPQGGSVTLDVQGLPGALQVAWYEPRQGEWQAPTRVKEQATLRLTAPAAGDWALHLTPP
jgi:hypothetical protein